ncbi:unannotated protein [freshwater metagenome]|uniref:Unannotated protein n=1 Tax=freshwater metagenome TaxID=449393 RepID=A0A6J7KTB1_9ZZZZ|nr:DUF1707 domain-containing protein [Actinomycetota bacterium]
MRGFGVKDGERERFVALIEAAYADGQIGDADRDLRLGRARGAETRDELVTLTRDPRPAPCHPSARGVGGRDASHVTAAARTAIAAARCAA